MDNPKHIRKSFVESVTASSRLVAQRLGADGSANVRVASDSGQTSTADRSADGSALYEISGTSRQNEAGVVEVCNILAERLRADGLSVGVARRASGVERGIDCEIPVDEVLLQVQVTRPATPAFWRTLAVRGSATRELDNADAIADVLALIRAKAAKAAPVDRKAVVLAIDATDTVVHSMDGFVSTLRRLHAADIHAIGFAAVWVIGPTSDSVHRVDTGEP